MRLILLTFSLLLSLHAKERIIAMSPAISEILFALGAGDQVVGVSDYATFPEEALALPKIGGYFNPSLERILALRPTLVVTNEHEMKIAHQLQSFGIKTLCLELKSLTSIKTSIQKIAQTLNLDPKNTIVAIDQALQQAKAHRPKNKPKVLIIFGISMDLSSGIYIAGHEIFFEEIIQACGASNAFTQAFLGQPSLNYEGLIAANPDIVILLHNKLTDTEDPKRVKALWQTVPIKASKNAQIHILDAEYISIPSHRVAYTIKDICEVIHGY